MDALWTQVWHNANHHVGCQPAVSPAGVPACPDAGEPNPDYDAASDYAIARLIDAGVSPEDAERSDVEEAQSYLTLAALRVPALVDAWMAENDAD